VEGEVAEWIARLGVERSTEVVFVVVVVFGFVVVVFVFRVVVVVFTWVGEDARRGARSARGVALGVEAWSIWVQQFGGKYGQSWKIGEKLIWKSRTRTSTRSNGILCLLLACLLVACIIINIASSELSLASPGRHRRIGAVSRGLLSSGRNNLAFSSQVFVSTTECQILRLAWLVRWLDVLWW
jgi:hypothetical protein